MRIKKVSQYIEGGAGLPSYFTDEIDTGMKWIDGRSIFRRVFTGTVNISTTNYNCVDIYFEENNIDYIIKMDGFIHNGNFYVPIPNRDITDAWFFGNESQDYRIRIYNYDKTNFPTTSDYILTIEYVKKAS